LEIVLEVVGGQLAPVGAEGVRLDQLRPGLDEADVQRHDRLWGAQVRLLGRAQTGYGGGQERPHPAVSDKRPTLEQPRLEAGSHAGKLDKGAVKRSQVRW